MSILANITIHLKKMKSEPISVLNIIDTLLSTGWTIDDGGKVSYLPLGDNDEFDWKIRENISTKEFKEIVRKKEMAGEFIGIIMTLKDTTIGGTFLFRLDQAISFNLDINRREIAIGNSYSITDFQWYLEKILPPLNEAFGVEYFSCEEHR
jgi:hypothetical protein